MKAVVYAFLITAGMLIVVSMLRSKRFFSALLVSALQGIVALFAADFIGGFVSVNLPVNGYTVLMSAIGGIPAVIFIVLLGVFFR